MKKVCWDFPLLGTGNQSGNNIAAITMFKGSGIMDGLAREICQNSLDAKDKDLPADIPVRVKFELVEINKSQYDMFDGYKEALDSSIEYWSTSPLNTPKIMEFLDNVKKALDVERVPVLIMSDYNTVGLNGVNAQRGEKSFWDLLVNVEGISIKQDDSSAGSFGIGKNAPFAYSALNLVFYNTLAKDGGRGFEGVARLVTTQKEYNGTLRPTQPIGKYLYLEDEYTGRPILPTDDCPLSQIDIFNRSKIGTDVAVFGFKTNEYENWEKNMAIAIIKNFVLAIINGKLEVEVKSPSSSYTITKDNVEPLLFRTFAEESQLKYTRQIYETLTNGELIKVSIEEKDDLNVYVKYEDTYSQSLSRFRSTGMLINTTTSDVLPHFSIVLVVNNVGNMELSKTLREAEPPQHTEWKAKNITDNALLKIKAARYLRKIAKEIQRILDEYDRVDITDKMDGGVGDYLPDSTGTTGSNEGNDGLKTDIKIDEITTYDGRVLYNSQYESAESGEGKGTTKSGVKAGKKKKKKRKTRIRIPVVEKNADKDKGVVPGAGKVKVVSPKIIEHRIFYKVANKYQFYVNCPEEYDRVFVQFYAGREDDKNDPVIVKNVKQANAPRVDVNSEKMGPLSLHKGSNTLYVEFENDEIMALVPVFTMEVTNEK